MKSKWKTLLIALVCLAVIALLIAAPAYILRAANARLLGGAEPLQRAPRADTLSDAGWGNPTARALYIHHAYVTAHGTQQINIGRQSDLEALQAGGVVPESCALDPGGETLEPGLLPNACFIVVEPVSGVVTSCSWTGAQTLPEAYALPHYAGGAGLETDLLLDRFAAFLGLSEVDDWITIEHADTQNQTMVGRWSPSTNLYLSAMRGEDGTSSGVSAASYTASEMQPLLTSNQLDSP